MPQSELYRYGWVRLLQIVSKAISGPDEGVCFIWPRLDVCWFGSQSHGKQ